MSSVTSILLLLFPIFAGGAVRARARAHSVLVLPTVPLSNALKLNVEGLNLLLQSMFFPIILPTKSQFEARLSISHLPEVNPELVILCSQLLALPF